LWIDAWALALRNAAIRTTLRRLDDRWRLTLVDVVESGVNDGVFTCEDPVASVSRVSALLDGLAVASLSYRNITRTQLRTWVREAMARELGLDPGVLR
jgi:hypothetical protein